MTRQPLRTFVRIRISMLFGIVAICLTVPISLRAQPTPTPTPTPPSIRTSIHVSASVMDPKNVADIFGRRISNRYVAVQLTISNSSPDFEFLISDVALGVKDIYIDPTLRPRVEYRPTSEDKLLVRGVAEKGQAYDPRNFIFRTLKAVGSIAATVTGFAGVGPSYAPTVAMFNGPGMTSYGELFPDLTINQMSRLNDHGYTAGTVLSKQTSKVVVAFLPQAVLMDSKSRSKFRNDPLSIVNQIDFRNLETFVYGTFMQTVAQAGPSIRSVNISAEEMAKFKGDRPEVKGQIIGRFLDGAETFLDEPGTIRLTLDGQPEENRIKFILKSDGPIPAGTMLNFSVIKNGQQANLTQPVIDALRAPTLTSTSKLEGTKGETVNLVLTGDNFLTNGETTRLLITPDERVDGESTIEVMSSKIKSPTMIEVAIRIGNTAPVKEYEIRVVTPAGISNPQKFKVLAPISAN